MNENETQQPKPVGNCKSSAKGKVHSNTGLPQETRKSQINNLTLHLKQLEKEEMKNLRVSRRKEILKLGQKYSSKKKRQGLSYHAIFFHPLNPLTEASSCQMSCFS